MTRYTIIYYFIHINIYTLHTVKHVQKWNVIKKLNSKAQILIVLFVVFVIYCHLLPCLTTQYRKISMYWCCIHRCNVIQFYIQGSIENASLLSRNGDLIFNREVFCTFGYTRM